MKLEVKPGVFVETEGNNVKWTAAGFSFEEKAVVATGCHIDVLYPSLRKQILAAAPDTVRMVRLGDTGQIILMLNAEQQAALLQFAAEFQAEQHVARKEAEKAAMASKFAEQIASAISTGKPVECKRVCVGEDTDETQERGLGWDVYTAHPDGTVAITRAWDY